MNTPFGDLLVRRRRELQLTQVEVCSRVAARIRARDLDARLTQVILSSWEVGRLQPRGRTELVEELGRVLEIQDDDLEKALATLS